MLKGNVLALSVVSTSLCSGEDVPRIEYDNQKMRGLLLSCLETGRIPTFPSKQRDKGNPLGEETIPGHSYCTMRETGVMLECCACQKWFHVNVTNQYQREVGRKRIIFGSAQIVKADYGTLGTELHMQFCIHSCTWPSVSS